MIRDFHVHTVFCDGKNTPEETVKAAIENGIHQLGILAHSYVPFDDCCIPLSRVDEFKTEISRLKEKYREQIDIFCGIEADIYSPQDLSSFDYTIGSVHYLKHGDEYIAIDASPKTLREMIDRFYDGDFYACAEDYFATVAKWAQKSPTIIGHFDLIKKFRRDIPFDSQNPRYKTAWRAAANALMPLGVPFEVNTGGIARGYLDEPYPSAEIIEYIKSNGGKLMLSSDAHRAENIGYAFDDFQKLI